MQRKFEQYLKHTCHCSPDKRYLVAVSGGIDSTVMAYLFHKSRLDFALAHCNFMLRGNESDEDQRFVEELADQFNVHLYLKKFDTAAYAETFGISIQMAARDLRYEWFASLKEKEGFDYIVVGHNQNDIVETVFLNLSRGCGIKGLTGIKARKEAIIRPLLFASRVEINSYASHQKLKWRDDASNLETKYLRNRIRHKIIPEFEAINSAFMSNAVDTIARLNQASQLLDYAIAGIKKTVWVDLPDKCLIDIEKLRSYPALETLLYELLKDYGCTHLNIRALVASFDTISGKQFFTRTHCITRDRTQLIITKNTAASDTTLLIDRETALVNYPVHLTFQILHHTTGFVIPVESCIALLDAEKLTFPLVLRRWKKGDSFKPLGMKGTKKISDYLINSKVPMPDKQHIWILESDGVIAWVVNHRIDDRFRITSETRSMLLVEFKNHYIT